VAAPYRDGRNLTNDPADPLIFKLTQEDREILEEIEGIGGALVGGRIFQEEADWTTEDEAAFAEA
jgi:hypothetical protein